MHRIALILVAAALSSRAAAGQESPFLEPRLHDALVQEISGDISFEHVRWFTHHHRPMGGSAGFEAVARYVEQKAHGYGLEDVRYIPLEMKNPSWTAALGELWLTQPVARRLAFTPEVALSLADYSRPTDVSSAELVDVGGGTEAGEYAGRDVAGKVVLATGTLAAVMKEAVWARGALGVIWFTTARRGHPDQVPWARIPVANDDRTKEGTFAFVLSQREGLRLRSELAAAAGTPFRVRARVESTLTRPGSQAIVEAVIRGSDIHDQDIVLTAHLQEERFSANDDASGCANVLEIARALKRMIDDGRLPRPRRDIRFWWVDEISAEENYFARFPDERRQLLANINQDMVGAMQSAGSRVQFVTRTPWSRASFLDVVASSIVDALVQGNTSYLSAGMARQLRRGESGASGGSVALEENPYSRPILARLGSRERYDARMIPFHNSTDHQVFNSALIAVPAVTFTNWPDDYIHSSDDDIWQIDATQLKRNAVAVAAIAWHLARAGDAEAAALAAHMHASAGARLAGDLASAVALLQRAAPEQRTDAWARARSLVEESERREHRALHSVARLAPGAPRTAAALAALSGEPAAHGSAAVRLLPYWTALTGERAAPAEAPGARERELSARVPVLVDDVRGYLESRSSVQRPPGLHVLMAYEALNFVDGTRSVLDIARAVAAEADAAGEWYYGRARLEDVAAYLESAEQAGIVRIAASTAADARPAARPRR